MAGPVDFSLHDIQGKTHRLADYRGQWVVVNFWASWCAPCVEEIPELIAFQAKYPQIRLLGVNFEQKTPLELRPFLKRFTFNYPLLMVGELPLTPFEPLKGLPTTAIIDPKGELVSRHTGPISAAMLEGFFAQEGLIKP
ncbi:MAG: TlpA family protein disulfide reductase [Gammaproteobacteria bacterium]|nr:TlpA family protein disulfide reductase [Gammaproteobacteria bacterium]